MERLPVYAFQFLLFRNWRFFIFVFVTGAHRGTDRKLIGGSVRGLSGARASPSRSFEDFVIKCFVPCVRHSWPSFTFFLTFFCGYSLCLSRPTDPILVLWSYHRYRGHVIYGRRLVFVCRICASVLSATENHGFAFRHR